MPFFVNSMLFFHPFQIVYLEEKLILASHHPELLLLIYIAVSHNGKPEISVSLLVVIKAVGIFYSGM